MTNLFDNGSVKTPLAERLRPLDMASVVGQDTLLGDGGAIARMLENDKLVSSILWGPAGAGKTTIARLLASKTTLSFVEISAVFSGVSDLRKIFDTAKRHREGGVGTLLFVDEIHRFNRSQQDAFLGCLEDGTIILIGATTENPSFELNSSLLSRCQVLVLKALDDDALEIILKRAETDAKRDLPLTIEARANLKLMSDGDGRFLLNLVEELFRLRDDCPLLDVEALSSYVQRRAPIYDKDREGHFNIISALHKSMRGSDVDAALYWLARMLVGGESPLYIVRRLVRFAAEDIGLADPNALSQANAAKDAYDFLGSPEGELAIAQAVIYLSMSPKSNANYRAYNAAMALADATGSVPPPKHILNAPTNLMKQLGYGLGYEYDHDKEQAFSGQSYFPEAIRGQAFYEPMERGFEREMVKRLKYWKKLRSDLGK